jgi:nucleotide-binding universal stress UspA family protein
MARGSFLAFIRVAKGDRMKILLAYDGFDHSAHAVAEAAKLAAASGADVTIFSVNPPDAAGSKSGGHKGIRPHAHEDAARAHHFLDEHGVASEMKLSFGDPATEILAELESGDYDLVVVGSRRRGPVARTLLGSVGKELVERAPCSVLVAANRPDAPVEQISFG